MVGEDQGISKDDILPPAGGEDDHFGNVVWSQRFTAPAVAMLDKCPQIGVDKRDLPYA